jgi:hypothetical protein
MNNFWIVTVAIRERSTNPKKKLTPISNLPLESSRNSSDSDTIANVKNRLRIDKSISPSINIKKNESTIIGKRSF